MDLKRYLPLLQVGVPLFGILALVNIAGAKAFGHLPPWTSEAPKYGSQSEIKMVSRTAGVVDAIASQKSGVLNLVLGQSTAYADLDCQELERECGKPSHWFSIGGVGDSFIKMENAVHPVFFGELHPHVCLLVVDPTALIGYPLYTQAPGEAKPVEADAVNWKSETPVWMLANRDYVNLIIQAKFDTARERFMGRMGLLLDVIYEPDAAPNKNPFPFLGHTPPENLVKAQESFEHLGYFKPESYRSDGIQAQAFLKLVAECRQTGAKVVVMLSPESEVIHSRIPVEATPAMEEVFDKARQGGDLTVINMQGTESDENMYDYMHVNDAERKDFTEKFILRLKAVLGPNYCAD